MISMLNVVDLGSYPQAHASFAVHNGSASRDSVTPETVRQCAEGSRER